MTIKDTYLLEGSHIFELSRGEEKDMNLALSTIKPDEKLIILLVFLIIKCEQDCNKECFKYRKRILKEKLRFYKKEQQRLRKEMKRIKRKMKKIGRKIEHL
ncbi:hypothetical protein Q0N30_26985 [Priestia megaterium]|uniref:hypothetical protein n=1 Tax=Priestia megaterium TaxID=1404 RepID=UPI0034597231